MISGTVYFMDVFEQMESNLPMDRQVYEKPVNKLVAQSTACMRATPSHKAELVSQVGMGQWVAVIASDLNGKWFLIQSEDKYQGWVEAAALCDYLPNNDITFSLGIITREFVFALNPTNKTVVVANLVMGNYVSFVLEEPENTTDYTIILPDGTVGLIPVNSLESLFDAPPLNQDGIISLAKRFVGVPYLWGGNSPRGFDCSGFIQFLYFMFREIVPRDACDQALKGKQVEMEDKKTDALQAGDLLFFGEIPGKITHVAMYIGYGQYIHVSGCVKVNSLLERDTDFDRYRYETWQEARRW